MTEIIIWSGVQPSERLVSLGIMEPLLQPLKHHCSIVLRRIAGGLIAPRGMNLSDNRWKSSQSGTWLVFLWPLSLQSATLLLIKATIFCGLSVFAVGVYSWNVKCQMGIFVLLVSHQESSYHAHVCVCQWWIYRLFQFFFNSVSKWVFHEKNYAKILLL